jgi:hypothetical protein
MDSSTSVLQFELKGGDEWNQDSTGLSFKSRIPPDGHDKFSVMPQPGNGLQPRVAASATPG